MTLETAAPELIVEPQIAGWIAQRANDADALANLERAALAGTFDDAFFASEPWTAFRERALMLWRAHDHVIVRGVLAAGDGASTILVALVMGRRFRDYLEGSSPLGGMPVSSPVSPLPPDSDAPTPS